jgi:hypothetical protein
MRRDAMAAMHLSPDEARLRRLVVEVGHDPAPLGREDIACVLRDLNGDNQMAAGALIVLHGLRRCEARPGDSVRRVACGVPIVAGEWAVVERGDRGVPRGVPGPASRSGGAAAGAD